MVHTPKGNIIYFKKDVGLCGGMPYVDLRADPATYVKLTEVTGVAMVQTVRKNYEGFTKEQVNHAIEVREAQAMMEHPSDAQMKQLVSSTTAVKNLDVTVSSIANARKIFGTDLAGLRGKTVWRRPEIINIPKELYEQIKIVTLVADVMFVNGLAFLVTRSRGIKPGTVEFLPGHTAKQLKESLLNVYKLYRQGGVLAQTCLMDMEFEKLVREIEEFIINCTAAREYVRDIERFIRVIKERARCITSVLPYKACMPDRMIIQLLKFVVMWLNALPNQNGFSPRKIVSRHKMDFKKHCKVKFGSYVEASIDADATKGMEDRTEECIALGPTGNIQASVACFNLETGRVVKRRTLKELPMPDRVIKKVMRSGKSAKQKQEKNNALQFLNRRQQLDYWDDEAPDEDEGFLEPDEHKTDNIPANFPGVALESDFEDVVVVQEESQETELAEADRALANSNLVQPHTVEAEITGVDISRGGAPKVIDDEDEGSDGDDDESDADEEDIWTQIWMKR